MTNNDQLALMELDLVWEPGLPFGGDDGPFSQSAEQELLWGYPGVLWAAPILPMQRVAIFARIRVTPCVAVGLVSLNKDA